MENAATRLLVALTALAVLWIVLYWAWPEPKGASRVTFSDTTEPIVDPTLGDPQGGGPAPLVINQGSSRSPGSNSASNPIIPVVVPDHGDREAPSYAPLLEVIPPKPATQDKPASGVIKPQFRDYTVQPGDSAWKIAEKEYGSARYWTVVANSNPNKSIENLTAGEVIRLAVDPDNIQGKPVGARTDPDRPMLAEYTVSSGDTLSEISKRFYGTVKYTDLIYNANRDKLRDKNDLRIGQVLVIPPEAVHDE